MAAITTGKPSTVPLVKAYLLSAIRKNVAALNLAAPVPSVVLSGIDEPENIDDFVIVGKEIVRQTEGQRVVGGGGLHWLRERYTVSLSIQCVQRFDDDFAACDARAYALLAAAEQSVRADPGMGGLVIQAMPGRSTSESSYEPDHGGALTLIESVVDVHAEL